MNRPIEPRFIADTPEALGVVFAASDEVGPGGSQQRQALNSLLRGVRQPELEAQSQIKPGSIKGKQNVAGKTTAMVVTPDSPPLIEEGQEQEKNRDEYRKPKD